MNRRYYFPKYQLGSGKGKFHVQICDRRLAGTSPCISLGSSDSVFANSECIVTLWVMRTNCREIHVKIHTLHIEICINIYINIYMKQKY